MFTYIAILGVVLLNCINDVLPGEVSSSVMIGGRLVNTAFMGAFLYEPWPRHKSQLYLGCYRILEKPPTSKPRPPKGEHKLVASSDEIIPFELCWRQCTDRTSIDRRNSVDFAGVSGNQKECYCFNHLLHYHEQVTNNLCDSDCVTDGQICKDTTMKVYLICYPGFYNPPFCQTQCAQGVCLPNNFPGTQFEQFHMTACRHNGECFFRCMGSDGTKCQKNSERCRVIAMDDKSLEHPHEYVVNEEFRELEDVSESNTYVLFDRTLTRSSLEGSLHGLPFITGLLAWHGAEGSAFFMTLEEDSITDSETKNYKIIYAGSLRDIGYPRTDMFYYSRDMVANPYGEKLTEWISGDAETYVGVRVEGGTPSVNKYLAVYFPQSQDANLYSEYGSAFYGDEFELRQGSTLQLEVCPESTCQKPDRKNRIAISAYAAEAYECTDLCLRKKCNCDGMCTYHCSPGRQGVRCQEPCVLGHYGLTCSYPCSSGCKDGVCDAITGECQLGCKRDGVTGAYCTELCPLGHYGPNCGSLCSANCLDPLDCDGITGKCTGGCLPGYKDDQCLEVCTNGFFGQDCALSCGSCAENIACDPVSGYCSDNCADASLAEPLCWCPPNKWGPGCEKDCPGCKSGVCDALMGTCVFNMTGQQDTMTEALNTLADNKDEGHDKKEKFLACGFMRESQRVPCFQKSHFTKKECENVHCCYEETEDMKKHCFHRDLTSIEKLMDFGGKWYRGLEEGKEYYMSLRSWKYQKAVDFCKGMGSSLAIPDSDTVREAIMSLITRLCEKWVKTAEANSFWIGLINEENACGPQCRGLWKWENGESFANTTRWHSDVEPEADDNVAKTMTCNPDAPYENVKMVGAVKDSVEDAARVGLLCRRDETALSEGNFGYMLFEDFDIDPEVASNVSYSTNTTDSLDATETTESPYELEVYKEAVDEVACNVDVDNDGVLEILTKLTIDSIDDEEVKGQISDICNNVTRTKVADSTELDPYESMCTSDELQSPDCLCPAGKFGITCMLDCGDCATVHCGRADGNCFGECEPGFEGLSCTTPCPSNWYGINCAEECGTCKDDMPCDHVTGQCTTCPTDNYNDLMCQGCKQGFYGDTCERECGKCDGDAQCDKATGYCEKCQEGYDFPFCKCEIGYYDNENGCDKPCGHCKDGKGCDPYSGACMEGCTAGYQGTFCNETCTGNTFGESCSMPCGFCSNSTACQTIDGVCKEGCAGGYRRPYCRCENQHFSLDCKKCGHCSNADECDVETGECPFGCAPGYKKPDCICKKHIWGSKCENKCGHCKSNEDCDVATGKCPNGCQIGYQGELCVDLCDFGFHGVECKDICGHCTGCGACNAVTGTCDDGCEPGYQSPFCHLECSDFLFGTCHSVCGACRDGKVCRKTDGKCISGCRPGYNPPFCVDQCPAGWWGENCLSKCGHCAQTEACNLITGQCPYGCGLGYQGLYCDEMMGQFNFPAAMKYCPRGFYGEDCQTMCGHCLEDACDPLTGMCSMSGCHPGYLLPMCSEVCVDGFWGHNCIFKCGRCFDNDEVCKKTDGTCKSGCAKGWAGKTCNFEFENDLRAYLLQSAAIQIEATISLVALLFWLALLS